MSVAVRALELLELAPWWRRELADRLCVTREDVTVALAPHVDGGRVKATDMVVDALYEKADAAPLTEARAEQLVKARLGDAATIKRARYRAHGDLVPGYCVVVPSRFDSNPAREIAHRFTLRDVVVAVFLREAS